VEGAIPVERPVANLRGEALSRRMVFRDAPLQIRRVADVVAAGIALATQDVNVVHGRIE